MAIYEKQIWIDRIVDTDTEEVIVEGSPVCARRLNHMEEGIYNLSVQCQGCNKGVSLSDIIAALGVCPTRLERCEMSVTLSSDDSWVWNDSKGLYEQDIDCSEWMPDDLTGSDARSVWFKVGYPSDPDPEVLQDFCANQIDYQRFNPETRIATFRSFGLPEFDQELVFVGYVLYDIMPQASVMSLINDALESAVSNGDLTKDQIREVFGGHLPNRVSMGTLETSISNEQLTYVDGHYESGEIPIDGEDAHVEIHMGEDLSSDQIITFDALSLTYKITDQGIILKSYIEQEKFNNLGEFKLPIVLLIQRVEGE